MAGNNDKLPTTTVHQARLQLYQSTCTPIHMTRAILVAWGTALISGRLGQKHAAFVESIFFNAEKTYMFEDGRVEITVDPYKVRMDVGGGKEYSSTTLGRLKTDVMQALVELRIKSTGEHIIAHIIDKIVSSKETKINPFTGQKRTMWSVTVSHEYMELIRHDLALHYDPRPIAQLNAGISQAIARLLLTHDKNKQPNGGWCIDSLIAAVGFDGNNNLLRRRRLEINNDAGGLAKLGVIIDGKKITRI